MSRPRPSTSSPGPVEGTHRAISDTVFATLRKVGLGPASRPVQIAHDGIAAGVYASVRGIPTSPAPGWAQRPRLYRNASGRTDWTPITSRPAGAVLTGAVNGLVGDHMVALHNDLAVPMTLHTSTIDADGEPRHAELPIASTDAIRDVVADHPERDLGHVVLFLHGLGETEHAWRLADEDSAGEGYAERLASSVGAVPLLLRYNTGMRIAHNGAALSVLLAELTERWPVPIRRLDLVGHSMGGLCCATPATPRSSPASRGSVRCAAWSTWARPTGAPRWPTGWTSSRAGSPGTRSRARGGSSSTGARRASATSSPASPTPTSRCSRTPPTTASPPA